MMSHDILQIRFLSERDVVLARQRTGEIAGFMGFASHEQTRVSTAVSEAVRDCLHHGGLDTIRFLVKEDASRSLFEIQIKTSNRKASLAALSAAGENIVNDHLVSGMTAARRLMDVFSVEQLSDGGAVISLGRFLPRGTSITAAEIKRITDLLARRRPRDEIEEVRQQNQELVDVLEEVRKRQLELLELNRELEDTNRGVLTLHSELQYRSEQLRKANELKTRFISEMSHEFRTPINSILSLCQILLARMDGDLTSEQEKQIGFIRKSADDLSCLVNDLLDLAKIEAGKTEIHSEEFEVKDLFGALRGMMRPLITSEEVQLVFNDTTGLPRLFTDETKVSQILRNLISNAIKFTERGEVRVSASLDAAENNIVFSVADTGIGIRPEDRDMIFHEFVQLRGPIQKKVKGTGLGLPLSKRLAELLGGTISFESRVGEGSNFYAAIPIHYREPMVHRQDHVPQDQRLPRKGSVLVVEDDPQSVLVYRRFLQETDVEIFTAASVSEARQILSQITPSVIVLDILLGGEPAGWDFLAELKYEEATKDIPVLVVTVLEDRERGMLLGAHDFCVKPIDRDYLLKKLDNFPGSRKLLVVDDEEVARYILKGLLVGTSWELIEARSGEEGLAKALKEQPDVITLDLVMPRMSGFEVLAKLKADPRTEHIPVIIVTSKSLDDDERRELEGAAAGILSKDAVSREQTVRALRKTLEEILVK
jgi:signal transduction histidine kinase/CheY-like chemotaxis protein